MSRARWLTLVPGVALLAWFFGYILLEADKDLVEKVGDEYRHYMQRVPRMNFAVGIVRLLQRRGRKSLSEGSHARSRESTFKNVVISLNTLKVFKSYCILEKRDGLMKKPP